MFESKKHLTDEIIKLYLEIKNQSSDLPHSKKTSIKKYVEEHIGSCVKCSTKVHIAESYYTNEKIYANKTRRTVIYSATVIILGFVLLYTLPWQKNDVSEAQIADGSFDTNNRVKMEQFLEEYLRQIEKGQKLTLIAFAKNKKFNLEQTFHEDLEQEIEIEELITRSPAKIKGISPENLSILSNPIIFYWNKLNGSATITIIDNKKRKVWEESTVNTDSLKSNIIMDIGTYYWEFRINDEPVTKRKFFVVD